MVTIKLLNNNELSNIATNKSYILCVRNYLWKIMQDVTKGIL